MSTTLTPPPAENSTTRETLLAELTAARRALAAATAEAGGDKIASLKTKVQEATGILNDAKSELAAEQQRILANKGAAEHRISRAENRLRELTPPEVSEFVQRLHAQELFPRPALPEDNQEALRRMKAIRRRAIDLAFQSDIHAGLEQLRDELEIVLTEHETARRKALQKRREQDEQARLARTPWQDGDTEWIMSRGY